MIPPQSPGRHAPIVPNAPLRVRFPAGPADAARASSPLVAVVVTLYDASSYDPLFREFKQEPPEGRVSVWECTSAALAALIDTLQGERKASSAQDPYAQLCAEIEAVDAASVVFNWECCGGCGDAGFLNTPLVMRAAGVLIARGYTLMFSDFSLKALIGAWSAGAAPRAFGPCPLVKLGEFGARFELRFDPKALQQCGSAQLERVGELCENGEASVGALGATIAYTLDADVLAGAPYRAEVLTVVTSFEGTAAVSRFAQSLRGPRVCAIGAHRGAAGHARLTFAGGGALLLSCGHWVELVKLDVTAERLVQVAQQTYGVERSGQMAQEMASAAPERRAALMQQYAREIVVQSTPGRYTKK